MKGKYIVIFLLIVLLIFTVYQMMQYESMLRDERTIKLYVEDESKPLLLKNSDEALKRATEVSDYYFTANGDYFKTLTIRYPESGKQLYWENLFLKGVNLGFAVPGKFPSEFSFSFDDYLDWFILIGEMNANTIRTYTILPPEFYEALSYYNLHYHNKPLYLIQGVWAEIPEGEDYYNPDYARQFQKEIIDMIDVVHGNAVLQDKPGKASGIYTADISRYVAAFLLGREWEPSAVFKTNQLNKINNYKGDFINMQDGNAMEAWLASMMDFSILYETQEYRFQHPISFVNWLPLDPMYHDTEFIENEKVKEYDNDLESIDFEKFHTTELFFPGIYAAYHAYPYYPDFVYLQDSYRNSMNKENKQDSYYNYLNDLKQHTKGMPLIVAEYGLPSSRGISHAEPNGFNQGGHSESEQTELSLLLTRDIVDAKCAGAIYFEWIDEWFKHNWLVMDFEQPFQNRKLWHNMENPEQNYGIYAMESRTKTIDGKTDDWETDKTGSEGTAVETDVDAGYFYMNLHLPQFDFDDNKLYIAIDTYDEEKGDHKLPFADINFDNGFEFLLEFKSTDSAFVLVDEHYSVFTDFQKDERPVYASKKNNNGLFIHQLMLTNRDREDLLGNKTDEVIIDRSPLFHGISSNPDYSNADWYYDNNTLELRLDWHLLNVSDPSQRYVLDDLVETKEIEYSKTDGFNLYVFITDINNNLIEQYPVNEPYFCSWEEWETPEYNSRLKPVYHAFKTYFKDLNPSTGNDNSYENTNNSFELADIYNNKKGAVSISFNNAGFSQYEYALPVLSKYGINASFGIIPELLDNNPGLYSLGKNIRLKRLGIRQVQELAVNNEIALQLMDGQLNSIDDVMTLERKSGKSINTLHPGNSSLNSFGERPFLFVRKNSENTILKTDFKGINYSSVNFRVSQIQLDSILKCHQNDWTILVFYNLYDKLSELPSNISEDDLNKRFINKSDFEKQIRLSRNKNYWIAPEADVYKYLKERNESTIRYTQYQNIIFLTAVNQMDRGVFNHPLTINFKTSASRIRIKGSENDGIFTNRTGIISFNVLPNKEITIEILDQ